MFQFLYEIIIEYDYYYNVLLLLLLNKIMNFGEFNHIHI